MVVHEFTLWKSENNLPVVSHRSQRPLILPSKAAAPKPAQSAPSTRWDQVFKCLSLRGKTVTQTTTEYLGRSEDNSEESTLFYLYVGPRD